jgi:nicotinamide mononucleotide adenylyltransferase
LQKDAFTAGRRQPAFKLVLGEAGKKEKLRVWVISDDMFHELLEVYNDMEDFR